MNLYVATIIFGTLSLPIEHWRGFSEGEYVRDIHMVCRG
jgi:hypothetical protein